MRYKLNGNYIRGQFQHNETKYPSNWLQLAEPSQLAALGITIEPDDIQQSASLDDAKTQKLQEINYLRDKEESEGFTYMGKVIDSDQVSIIRIGIAAQAAAANPAFSVNWTAKDNSILILNQAQMLAMPAALAEFSATIHYKARALKDSVIAAITIEDVAAITYQL
jgi:hypothetical protein